MMVLDRTSYDAVIVGGRCAGAATGMLLARQGATVLVVDRSPYGSDTLSTHALMRGAVLQLSRWGLLPTIEAARTPAINKTRFFYDDDVVEIDIKPRDGVEVLYAPRRSVLDALLVDEARRAGATVLHGPRVTRFERIGSGAMRVEIEDRDGRTHAVRTPMVVGADGWRSTVAALVGSQTYRRGHASTGVVYGHFTGLDVDAYEWRYRAGVSAGVVPTNGPATCIFASVPSSRFEERLGRRIERGFDEVLREVSPDLGERVARSRQVGRLHGFPGVPGWFRQSWGPGWALVGDAGYFKDPLTAHGITDALRDAELLARAITIGTDAALADYQATRDALAQPVFEATERVATFDWDMAELRELHRGLSRGMNLETAHLAALAGPAHSAVAMARPAG